MTDTYMQVVHILHDVYEGFLKEDIQYIAGLACVGSCRRILIGHTDSGDGLLTLRYKQFREPDTSLVYELEGSRYSGFSVRRLEEGEYVSQAGERFYVICGTQTQKDPLAQSQMVLKEGEKARELQDTESLRLLVNSRKIR